MIIGSCPEGNQGRKKQKWDRKRKHGHSHHRFLRIPDNGVSSMCLYTLNILKPTSLVGLTHVVTQEEVVNFLFWGYELFYGAVYGWAHQ